MTARMIMLNCVQETSGRAAVVLSVGLFRLVIRAWVVAAVLSVLLMLLPNVAPETPLAVVGVKMVVVVVEGEDVLVVGASIVVAFAGVGMSRRTERKAQKSLKHETLITF